ncbi:hypothetical protein ACFFMP_12330 [Pseudoroseomonas cervicalis]|uniref:Tat pathway signal sequence domain protein n=1 Tax=Pseudoroseomonas cervicalis ATCC 49957 TaxID=525371 RepID=D5RIB2_9PROT|nr:hypothetical protein [Pseudoroseomonas cervicalis]EFH12939.1 hypothetical protein HMPREF0731_0822 [Pseudoroseomonas cervicalis ATCC 49957]
MRKLLLAAFAAASLAGPVLAQGSAVPGSAGGGHGHADQGPHGGRMQDVVGVHAELLVIERKVTIHLYDEGSKPVPAAGFSGSLLIGTGQAREVVQLAPGEGNSLVGEARTAPARGAAVTMQIKNPAGRSAQARF